MHRVHTYPVLRVLHSRRLRHYAHRALRRVISHMCPGLPHHAADRRYVHDGAAAYRLHLRNHAPHPQEYALGIYFHEVVPCLGTHMVRVMRPADPRVVHQDVHLAIPRHRRFHRRIPSVLARNIQMHEHRIATRLSDLRLHLPAQVLRHIRDDHFRALTREYAALLRAHSASPTRDNRYLAIKPHDSPQPYICDVCTVHMKKEWNRHD